MDLTIDFFRERDFYFRFPIDYFQFQNSIGNRKSPRCYHQRFPAFRSSTMCREARMESARMVQVQFLSPCDTKGAASTTNRFFTSWACCHLFSADFLGSLPMRTVPTSWMISPGCVQAVILSAAGFIAQRNAAHFMDDPARKFRACVWLAGARSPTICSETQHGMPNLSTFSGSISQ
jgi:hypothetical protein